MKQPGNYKIPFARATGERASSMLEYTTSKQDEVVVPGTGWHGAHEWRENVAFDATVDIEHTYRGRSAARVVVRNAENGERYSMGLAGFADAVKAFGSRRGQIRGRWVFVKQGSNYALAPLTEE